MRQPALVVLDLRLEDGSGLALLDRVRAADGLASRIDPELPVIVLSGRSGDADRVRSFARGADDHLNKPTCSLFPRAEDRWGRSSSTAARTRPARRRSSSHTPTTAGGYVSSLVASCQRREATSGIRRTLTATTAGALALVGALLGVAGAYVVVLATNHDHIGHLRDVPVSTSLSQ